MQHQPIAEGTSAAPPVPLRMGVGALLLILAFWTVFAVATMANELMSPFGPRWFSREFVTMNFLGAYLWAALTPGALWLVSRYSLEEGNRAGRILLYLVVAGALALLVSFVLALVGNQMLGGGRRAIELSAPGRLPLHRPFRSWLGVLIRSRFLIDLMASLLVISAGIAWDYFRRSQARRAEAALLREQLVDSRLQVLRAQLNPHFLFNTLNAVSGLVASDPPGVRRMIARLGEVLRYSLDGAREQETRVEDELDILRRYLEILEIRYQGRLTTEVTADPEVLDALVPTLILQPLAENAMTHGVARAGGRGRIVVRARRVDDELVLTVRDTGAGDGAEGGATEGGLGGMGLRHVGQRLEQLYGSAHRLELRPHPEGGMIAEIALPYHLDRGGAADRGGYRG